MPGGPQGSLRYPGFHHLHLNSVNPEAAIDFYTKAFPSTSKTTFAGQPALRSPNNVLVLFNKVATPPATQPQTAFWHFGWHVTNVREALDRFLKQNVTLVPLYTGERRRHGLYQQRYVAGIGRRARPHARRHRGGEGEGCETSWAAPALRISAGRMMRWSSIRATQPAERFNHVHMYQDQPFCAQLWYQTHLNVAPRLRNRRRAPRPTAWCERGPDKTLPALDWDGMYRTPSVTSTVFGDVSLFWYMNQGGAPAVSTRGH